MYENYTAILPPAKMEESVIFIVDLLLDTTNIAREIFRLPSADRYIAELADEPQRHLL